MATSLPSTPLGIFTWKMQFLQNQSIFHWKVLLLLKYLHLLPGNQTIICLFGVFWINFIPSKIIWMLIWNENASFWTLYCILPLWSLAYEKLLCRTPYPLLLHGTWPNYIPRCAVWIFPLRKRYSAALGSPCVHREIWHLAPERV